MHQKTNLSEVIYVCLTLNTMTMATRTANYGKSAHCMCTIRTLVFLIGISFLIIQVALLGLNIFIYVDGSKAHVGSVFDWFQERGVQLSICSGGGAATDTDSTNNNNSTGSSSSLSVSTEREGSRDCIIRVSIKLTLCII